MMDKDVQDRDHDLGREEREVGRDPNGQEAQAGVVEVEGVVLTVKGKLNRNGAMINMIRTHLKGTLIKQTM